MILFQLLTYGLWLAHEAGTWGALAVIGGALMLLQPLAR